jgi:hypothetical protein
MNPRPLESIQALTQLSNTPGVGKHCLAACGGVSKLLLNPAAKRKCWPWPSPAIVACAGGGLARKTQFGDAAENLRGPVRSTAYDTPEQLKPTRRGGPESAVSSRREPMSKRREDHAVRRAWGSVLFFVRAPLRACGKLGDKKGPRGEKTAGPRNAAPGEAALHPESPGLKDAVRGGGGAAAFPPAAEPYRSWPPRTRVEAPHGLPAGRPSRVAPVNTRLATKRPSRIW